MKPKKSYGKLTLGAGTPDERVINIIEALRINYIDRSIQISKTEENAYMLAVHNPIESGRNPKALLYLSFESMIALYTAMTTYFAINKIDCMNTNINSSKDDTKITCTPNLEKKVKKLLSNEPT